ncbi:hypothetical protein HanXRQr2_Chr08g0334391 [Helianthus annuus]|uniref:Uncharacterized protein n=1 Tax=Helianthus annuus TaxID=4232 RepID=A0A9K3IEB7_HELAN|nr:hypothetical protein HanXRQr2_Chr08g0334391 [Helianthus annuus]
MQLKLTTPRVRLASLDKYGVTVDVGQFRPNHVDSCVIISVFEGLCVICVCGVKDHQQLL